MIIATPFSDPSSQSSSWLNPFRILPRTSHAWDVGNIIAVRQVPHYQSMQTEEKLIWALTDKYLMLWNVNLAGGEQVNNCTLQTVFFIESPTVRPNS